MYKNVTDKLNLLFDTLNEIVFDGSFQRPKFRIFKSKTWKNWYVKKISENELYEISLCEERLKDPYKIIVMKMLHQMIHIYCSKNHISDSSRKMRYHNKIFRNYAMRFGLIVPGRSADGFTEVDIRKDVYNAVRGILYDENCFSEALEQDIKMNPAVYDKLVELECPLCHVKAKTGRKAVLICGKCYKVMELIR